MPEKFHTNVVIVCPVCKRWISAYEGIIRNHYIKGNIKKLCSGSGLNLSVRRK